MLLVYILDEARVSTLKREMAVIWSSWSSWKGRKGTARKAL
jgi:hypothetical protein